MMVDQELILPLAPVIGTVDDFTLTTDKETRAPNRTLTEYEWSLYNSSYSFGFRTREGIRWLVMCQGLEGSVQTTTAFIRQYTYASLTKNKQGIQPAFASLCRASLPSRTRCSPLKLGLASLSFFHLGKTLQTLDFKFLLSCFSRRSLMSQGKHNSLSLARPLLFFQGRLSSAKTESVTLGKEKKGEGSRWNPARQALAFGRLAYCSR
ncbi:hypothetical protein V6N11_021659 [Hibiscus sabdariffa]|uniref:Uncharacterized protein n=1 Tax=Hibiscus sabdariffa TaxID=183260 RepID=A0ABR1ZQD4_9ROSI